MDVYLLPIGAERYELYCEEPDEGPADDPPRGFFRRMKRRFSLMLSEAEHERRRGHVDRRHEGWTARGRARMMRWVAEAVAEQRLLWHLRRQAAVAFFYPHDLEEPRARALLRRQLARDFDKHRFWLIIDSLAFVASGLLFILPGPNLVAYYFAFRMVGHYLSIRGARHGLDAVQWNSEGSAPLSSLRGAIDLDPELRDRQVRAVEAALRLEHLSKFFERTALDAAGPRP